MYPGPHCICRYDGMTCYGDIENETLMCEFCAMNHRVRPVAIPVPIRRDYSEIDYND
jgi:hypothetical protein